ncbi:MAG: hypothetical protein K0R75_1508, partial [Paenibacillaceae bacterium]|nr:hypothetical protein [Paenibacillaceae bacterium]
MSRFRSGTRSNIIAAFMLLFGLLYSAAASAQDSATPLFSDVPADHWAAAAISAAVERGIADGYEDGTFRPDAKVSREQFAKLLALTLKLAIPAAAVPAFNDVPADRWSAPYIEAVKSYIPGKKQPDGQPAFEPETAITRGEVAAAIGDQYLEGYPDGTSRPQESLTRAEAMTVLARLVAAQPTATPTTADTPAATPVIEIDNIPETVYFKDLHISGRVTDKSDPTPTLTLNGEKIWFSGSFKAEMPLVEGENTLRFAATNSSGKTAEVVLRVTYAIQPPKITVSRLPVKSVDLTEPVTIDVQDWYDKKSQ